MSTSSSTELDKLFEQPLVHKPGEPSPPKLPRRKTRATRGNTP